MKLNFVIIGGMKCGSTALGEYFREHPDVNFCNMIETDFFSHNSQNIKSLEKYFKIYYETDHNGLKGESSPTYSYLSNLPSTAQNLKRNFPKIKIILVIRNPFNRIISHINHQRLEKVKINDNILTHLKNYPDIIEKSMFGSILEHYQNIFENNDIKVIPFEDILFKDGLLKICNFLDINYYRPNLPEANKTDNRFYTLPFVNLYKRNYLFFKRIPLWSSVKGPLKTAYDHTFSRKLKHAETCKLDSESKSYISEKMKYDDILFTSLMGYSYYSLKK